MKEGFEPKELEADEATGFIDVTAQKGTPGFELYETEKNYQPADVDIIQIIQEQEHIISEHTRSRMGT